MRPTKLVAPKATTSKVGAVMVGGFCADRWWMPGVAMRAAIRYRTGPDAGASDGTPQQHRRLVPPLRDARDPDARRQPDAVRPARWLQGRLLRGREGDARQAAAPVVAAHAQARIDAVRARRPGVDRGRRHRPRLSRAQRDAAAPGHDASAGRARRAPALDVARSQ